ncbi:hypothetical protein B5S27_g1457 [[Candida] boidinii]|nr:hypothetical protein B5S27_g1457 [[Candida] boidinii]
MAIALEEAKKSYEEGGIPIGRGHNKRVQDGSPILHGETDTLNNAGRLPGDVYKHCTMYTTLSPCNMCTGTCLLYGIPRVVMGENNTYVGGEDWLKHKGVEVVNVQSKECEELMQKFIREKPELWNEDIGV